MIMDFQRKYNDTKNLVEESLPNFIDNYRVQEYEVLFQAMEYSLMAGGKRFRPVVHLETISLLGGDKSKHLDSACALEFIHTYSLIHDDLPAMDNDDYRRGKLTNHKVFGEDVAILSGDGLLNAAYEILFEKIKHNPTVAVIQAAEKIAKSAGANGMIAGQIIDLASEGKEIDLDTLLLLHKKKTGALIESSILSAAMIMQADERQMESLSKYATHLGLAFQIWDDILDYEGSFEELGKPIGSDAANMKSTFVAHYGLEKSKEILDDTVNEAIRAIDFFKSKGFFVELARYVASRKN